jgi:hypothetical protein
VTMRSLVLPRCLLILGVAAVLAAQPGVQGQDKKADGDLPAELKKASVDGKYGNLLKKFEVAGDKEAYGEFNDYGRYEGTEWAGQKNLPPGYWVYVAPNWYIWGEEMKK